MDSESQIKLSRMIMTEKVASIGTFHGGYPLVSMVLYVASSDFLSFFFQASRLAQHTQDFLVEPRIGLMIREPDNSAKNLQLLARISIIGTVEEIASATSSYSLVRNSYLKKFQESSVTMQLPDFSFFAIRFMKARYVAGFGKAFNLHSEDMRAIAKAAGSMSDN